MSKEITLSRPRSEYLDSILGKKFKVLDDGFVRVIDYMGNDAAIVQAARVSYGEGTKHVSDDRSLIRYLMRHRHTSPFEMCEIKLHVRVPMDTWRQWVRHRTANINEYSTRYSEAIDSMQKTAPDKWRLQATDNKQGSTGYLPQDPEDAFYYSGEELSRGEKWLQDRIREAYQDRLDSGVAREQARKDLPLSTYTEAYWKIDLHNLLHFLELRMDSHAQEEIRSYAITIYHDIVYGWVPEASKAFDEYMVFGVSMSLEERNIISHLLAGNTEIALRQYKTLSKREQNEFGAKFLGFDFEAAYPGLKEGTEEDK